MMTVYFQNMMKNEGNKFQNMMKNEGRDKGCTKESNSLLKRTCAKLCSVSTVLLFA